MRAPEPGVTPQSRGSPERPLSVPTVLQSDDVTRLTSSLIRGHHRVGSEPLLSPQPLTKARSGTFDWLDVDAKNMLTGSDSELTRPPPPKPTRLPTIRIGRDEKKPLVQIRNQALYDDDGSDYSDYSQVVINNSIIIIFKNNNYNSSNNSRKSGDASRPSLRIRGKQSFCFRGCLSVALQRGNTVSFFSTFRKIDPPLQSLAPLVSF